jgi:hypothetical protein
MTQWIGRQLTVTDSGYRMLWVTCSSSGRELGNETNLS